MIPRAGWRTRQEDRAQENPPRCWVAGLLGLRIADCGVGGCAAPAAGITTVRSRTNPVARQPTGGTSPLVRGCADRRGDRRLMSGARGVRSTPWGGSTNVQPRSRTVQPRRLSPAPCTVMQKQKATPGGGLLLLYGGEGGIAGCIPAPSPARFALRASLRLSGSVPTEPSNPGGSHLPPAPSCKSRRPPRGVAFCFCMAERGGLLGASLHPALRASRSGPACGCPVLLLQNGRTAGVLICPLHRHAKAEGHPEGWPSAFVWRRGGDSNPRGAINACLISSQVHSTALPPLRAPAYRGRA